MLQFASLSRITGFGILATAILFSNTVQAQVGGGQVPSRSGTTDIQTFQKSVSPGVSGLNLIAVPFYRKERYDAYDLDVFRPGNTPEEARTDRFTTDSFDIRTSGLSLGFDYVAPSGLMFGGLFTLQDGKTKFDIPSAIARANNIAAEFNATGGGSVDFAQVASLGEPVEKEFNSAGVTLAGGYVSDNFSIIGTFGLSNRKYDTVRREWTVANADDISDPNAIIEFDRLGHYYNEGSYDSWLWDFELGATTSFKLGFATILPTISIGYHREDAEGYSDTTKQAFFTENPVTAGSTENLAVNRFIEGDCTVFIPGRESGNVFCGDRDFSSDHIVSIPLSVGFTSDIPVAENVSLILGAMYTYDFADQERTLSSKSFVPTGPSGEFVEDPTFSYLYQERQHNRHMVSLETGLSISFTESFRAFLDYRHDFGLEGERSSADFVQLQLRIVF
jgi:hypothetical protein